MGTIVNQLIAQQVGFEAADAETADALHLVKRLHEVEKRLVCGATEVAYVDASYHYLLATLTCSLLSLGHQRTDGWVSREATGKGNGAIGTEIVAAILHFQEVTRTVAA